MRSLHPHREDLRAWKGVAARLGSFSVASASVLQTTAPVFVEWDPQGMHRHPGDAVSLFPHFTDD